MGRPSARRWCRARARPRSRPPPRPPPPRRAGARPASRPAAAAPRGACGPRGSAGDRAGARRSTSSSASKRWAERHARRTTRSECGASVASASSRSAIACGPGSGGAEQPLLVAAHDRAGLAHQALDLDVLGHLAQRGLAQRREVLDLEEVVQRRRHALGAVDLARPAGARSAPPASGRSAPPRRPPRAPRRGSSRARARR